MALYTKLNGKFVKEEDVRISPNNRSFRYGDGFFETFKIHEGKILLADLHFERLFNSLRLLHFDLAVFLTAEYFKEQVLELIKKNRHEKLARVRLTIFRGDGGLLDDVSHFPNHLIQSWPLNEATNVFNQNGLVTDVYTEARKVADHFSAVKSNNYLSYAMAALWAKKNRLNDCFLLNPFDHITDSTIANVFIVSDGVIKTPPLCDGPVNGVMRRHLLASFKINDIAYEESSVSALDLENASEIFVTNAISGIKWVRQFKNRTFENTVSSGLHKQFIAPLLKH